MLNHDDDGKKCQHDMNPEWCANCRGLYTPEEEEQIVQDQLIKLAEKINSGRMG